MQIANICSCNNNSKPNKPKIDPIPMIHSSTNNVFLQQQQPNQLLTTNPTTKAAPAAATHPIFDCYGLLIKMKKCENESSILFPSLHLKAHEH